MKQLEASGGPAKGDRRPERPETLDHISVTKELAKQVEELRYVHIDNDYYERNETTSPTGVSDHDPRVVRLTIPAGGLG